MKRINILLLAIIITSLAIRLLIAWQPVQVLDEKILLDDSLYGYSTAKNLAAGSFLTYNGVDKTNGVQVLWILLITPVYILTSNIYLAINTILTIQAVIDTLIVFLIFKLAKNIFGEKAGLLASFIWAINPLIFFQTMSGIDVTLYIFLVLASMIFYDKIKDRPDIKNVAVLGFLLGLTFLARGDGIFLFVIIAAHMLLRGKISRPEKGLLKKIPIFSKEFLTLAAVSLLTVLPWLAWNYATFGTLQQSSFLANYYMNRGIIPFYDITPPTSLFENLSMAGESFLRAFGSLVHQMGVIDFFTPSIGTIVLIPFLLLTAYALLKEWKKMLIPVLFSVALLIFYGGYIWGINIRYMTPLMPFLVIFEAVGILKVSKSKLILYTLVALLAVTLFSNGLTQWERGYLPWQGEIYKDAIWLSQNTPQDAIIASFASGNIIYFSNRTVIGMDGVVDYNSINVVLQKKVYSYWKERNVTYWVENTYHNQTGIEEWENGTFDVLRENQWHSVFESDAKLELIDNRCNVYHHMRGFDMLVCFYKVKVD
jgi:4-amino-4-deoxy-L-arabinose transferase-like glycosyltransferase